MGSNGGKSSNISSNSSILAYLGTYNGYKKTPICFILGIGGSNWALYEVQDSHHGPFIGYNGNPGPHNGYRKAPCALYWVYRMAKVGLIPGTRKPAWALHQI